MLLYAFITAAGVPFHVDRGASQPSPFPWLHYAESHNSSIYCVCAHPQSFLFSTRVPETAYLGEISLSILSSLGYPSVCQPYCYPSQNCWRHHESSQILQACSQLIILCKYSGAKEIMIAEADSEWELAEASNQVQVNDIYIDLPASTRNLSCATVKRLILRF